MTVCAKSSRGELDFLTIGGEMVRMPHEDCIFCKIASGAIKSQIVYEDDQAVAFRDLNPQAPTHILVIPRAHLASLAESNESHQKLLGHLLGLTRKIAEQEKLPNRECRVVVNVGPSAGQTVFHLHLHVMGGRPFSWPPG